MLILNIFDCLLYAQEQSELHFFSYMFADATTFKLGLRKAGAPICYLFTWPHGTLKEQMVWQFQCLRLR